MVQTTRRKGASYLSSTLRQLGRVGRRRHVIVSDGPLVEGFEPPAGWEVLERPWQGARATGWACLELAARAGVADAILLQDDLELCADAAQVLEGVVVPPRCIAASFYTPFALPGFQPAAPGRPRLVLVRACGTAQALKLPRAALELLAGLDPFAAAAAFDVPPLEPHLFDDSMMAIARASSLPLVAHVLPNPVDHVGRISACGTQRPFRPLWTLGPGSSFGGDPCDLVVHDATAAQA